MHGNATSSLTPGKYTAEAILVGSLSKNSQESYSRSIRSVYAYLKTVITSESVLFPTSAVMLIKYIEHAVNAGLSSATIITQLSAISFLHKLVEVPDPTKTFVIKKMLVGAQNLSRSADTRLPFQSDHIRSLIQSLVFTAKSPFHKIMLQAMYLLAFAAFLRIGEFTVTKNGVKHVIKYQDIQFITKNAIIVSVQLSLFSFKHSKPNNIVKLIIPAQSGPLCPVKALSTFVHLRGTHRGPLFTFPDKTPVSSTYFASQLKLSVIWAGLDPNCYKPHSFRIGAATAAAERGATGTQITAMGRWHSDAYKRYIRIPTLSV